MPDTPQPLLLERRVETGDDVYVDRITADGGVWTGGTVTAEIKDQPWDVALKAILEAQGLAANEETSGIITVDSYKNILEKQSSEPVTPAV